MKRLTILIILAMVLCCSVAWAATVTWNASVGASGYEIQWRALGAPTWTAVDAGNVLTWTTPTSWVAGTRYEIKARAYTGPVATRSFSGDSDTLRWTLEPSSVIVELPSSPRQMIFNFGP
jgi:hypothetical protein